MFQCLFKCHFALVSSLLQKDTTAKKQAFSDTYKVQHCCRCIHLSENVLNHVLKMNKQNWKMLDKLKQIKNFILNTPEDDNIFQQLHSGLQILRD